jgi:hypothetical protein
MNLIDKSPRENSELTAKEQERKDLEYISKAENILFDKYKNIKNFDKAIK